ncbi:hypothetical protein DMN91_007863 [Ooceraea biroi]|uniref:Pre-rRNA-processing protein TSR2 homolog n=1 Tax=Ooceraea biroi TaxID=2015173 RepID=A0A3L8DG74_OOCBI|nr:uncharacterized protein LOC105280768 [Ooceraea biroi]RLU19306.1 hypothetical protein DMN91_007863 [Ooceraea biroi]
MEHTKPFFLSVTQRIFSNWTALRLAVEHDMGPLESAVQFCPYMTEVLYMNDGLTNGQIAEELENYMEEEFNTEMEDESSVQVAAELLRFYQYCMEGNEPTAKAELDKLPPLQSWLVSEQPSQPSRPTRPLPVQHESSSDEDMDVDNNEDGDGEWTVVTSRRNR